MLAFLFFVQHTFAQGDAVNCQNQLDAVVYNGGMLEFQNIDHFKNVLNCLENEVEAHNTTFDAQCSGLNDDQIEMLEEKLGFNEFKPLLDFESSKRFISLRSTIELAITSWLEHPVLDTLADPDEHPVDDEVMRTLLNASSQVRIAGQVYSFNTEGGGNNSPDSGCCRKWRSAKVWFPYAENREIKLKGSVRNWGIVSSAKAKVVSFKRKPNGNWKRYRTRLVVSISGTGYTDECSRSYPIGAFKGPKNRKRLTAKINSWIGHPPFCVMPNTTSVSATVGPNMISRSIGF